MCVCVGRGMRRQHCMKTFPKKPLRSAAFLPRRDNCNAYLPSISCIFTFRSASPCLHIHLRIRPTCKQHTLTKLSVVRRHPISPRAPLLLPSPPLLLQAHPPPGRSGQAGWLCPHVAQGAVSSARAQTLQGSTRTRRGALRLSAAPDRRQTH